MWLQFKQVGGCACAGQRSAARRAGAGAAVRAGGCAWAGQRSAGLGLGLQFEQMWAWGSQTGAAQRRAGAAACCAGAPGWQGMPGRGAQMLPRPLAGGAGTAQHAQRAASAFACHCQQRCNPHLSRRRFRSCAGPRLAWLCQGRVVVHPALPYQQAGALCTPACGFAARGRYHRHLPSDGTCCRGCQTSKQARRARHDSTQGMPTTGMLRRASMRL